VLDLNETQEGVLAAVFKIADDSGLLLLDLKDLRSMLQFAGDNAAQFRTQYGNISTASVGAIQRGLLTLESQGGDRFFGEPALALDDLMQTDGGRGVVSILAADKLLSSPRVYSTMLLWLLSELFENLPEIGDPEKPKLVFFFDEAHLLFNDAPKELLERIEQVVRLVRSKGVGVYFVTQNPLDVPQTVLGQLGNRVQHALRAFTPRDQAAVKSRGHHVPRQSEARRGEGDRRARGGRGAGLVPRREGPPERGRARLRRSAGLAPRAAQRCRASQSHRRLARGRAL
jgi:DNA helicase HerA-like ATPase